MSVLYVTITTKRPNSYLTSNFETAGGKYGIVQRVINYLQSVSSGSELAVSSSAPVSVRMTVQSNTNQATGSLIFNGVVANDTFVLNGVTFTCVASGAVGNQFNVGGSDTLTAVAAAAAVNASASALVSGMVTAAGAAGLTTTGVVTFTSAFYSISGNQTTITGGTHVTASGARLTGGQNDASAQTLTF